MFDQQRKSAAAAVNKYGAITSIFRNSSQVDLVQGEVLGKRSLIWSGKGLLSNFSYEMKDGTRTRVDSMKVLLPADAVFEQDDILLIAGKEYVITRELDVNPNGETPIIRTAEVKQ